MLYYSCRSRLFTDLWKAFCFLVVQRVWILKRPLPSSLFEILQEVLVLGAANSNHFARLYYRMDQGIATHGEPGLLTTDDPFNTSPLTEVADYSSVPPVLEPPIPIPAVKAENSASESGKSGDQNYKQNSGADYSMEAPILAEDVIRAGGLGARDELGHFLPSAMDATDFEASLRDAQQYEDLGPENDIPRPGVGFVKDQQQQMDGFREV